MELIRYLKIDVDKIKLTHLILMKKAKMGDGMTLLNYNIMKIWNNHITPLDAGYHTWFRYSDINKYIQALTNSIPNKNYKISITQDDIDIIFKNTDRLYLNKIQEYIHQKETDIKKYIILFDNLFIQKSISIRTVLYRCMKQSYSSNVIDSYSSWSLIPLYDFCKFTSNNNIIHLYRLSGGSKGLYIELFDNILPFVEYEVVLPRNIKFKEYKTKEINILNPDYIFTENPLSSIPKYNTAIIHYVRLL